MVEPPSSRPIRLLQFVHGYPPAVGGVEHSVRDRCERLVADHGFDVTVLTTNCYTVEGFRSSRHPTIPIEEEEVQNGVRILRFPVWTLFGPLLDLIAGPAYRLRLPGNDLLRTLYAGPICPRMLRTARTIEADVVCAASFPLNHMRYPFRLPEPRAPIVLIGAVHTNDAWGYDRPNLLRLVNRSYATIAHTEPERAWLISHGAEPGRVKVIPLGIDEDGLAPRPGTFRDANGIPRDGYLVAYFGQQGSHKGIDVLIRTFPTLLERCPNAWLVVAGSRTPFTTRLEELARDLSSEAQERFRLVTDLDEQAKVDLLGDCDVFASPSQSESFGITTLEAWSLGKPVVVGDAPSQSSVVEDRVTGLIVPYGDEALLGEALERLAEPGLRDLLGQAGRDLVHHRYRRRQIDATYADLFRSAADAQGSGRHSPSV